MAISDSDKIDYLWKKIIGGTSRTSGLKDYTNETVASPLPVFASGVWTNTDATSIPANPPASNTNTIAVYFGANRIACTNDPTSPPNQTWFTGLTNFVPTVFGPSYLVQVYVGDPNGSKYARIYPSTTGYEYIFDYVSGTLNFDTGIPANLPSIGSTSGNVSVATDGVYIEAYQYTGTTLTSALTGASKTTVVANIAARNALSPNVGDIVHVNDASGDPANANPGDYADYLWNGTYWACIATQTSARADAKTQYLTFSHAAFADGADLIGNIGPGARIVEISIQVIQAFDQGEVTVGDSAQNDIILSSDEVDLSTVGVYVATPYYQFPYSTDTACNLYYTGSPTSGAATVTITYA